MSGRDVLARDGGAAVLAFDVVAAIPAPDLSDPAVGEFAEQFALDVSSVDEVQRGAFLGATGDQAFAVVQQIYAHDFVPRVRSVLDAIFGASDWPAPAPVVGPVETWPVLETFMVEVARLRSLDPVLTELARLRGARLHDCAVCRSRRSQDAIAAGADESAFDAVDTHASSNLPDPVKAALALADTLIQAPYDVPAEVVTAVRTHLREEQTVEVVLDVMRNAANKIAVALGADAANVSEGVELFTTDADGNVTTLGPPAG